MDMTVSPHSVTPYAFNYYVVDRPGGHCAQLHNTAVVAQWMCEGELGGDNAGRVGILLGGSVDQLLTVNIDHTILASLHTHPLPSTLHHACVT